MVSFKLFHNQHQIRYGKKIFPNKTKNENIYKKNFHGARKYFFLFIILYVCAKCEIFKLYANLKCSVWLEIIRIEAYVIKKTNTLLFMWLQLNRKIAKNCFVQNKNVQFDLRLSVSSAIPVKHISNCRKKRL